MRHGGFCSGLLGAALLCVAAPEARSADVIVDLELVLAVDISRSMDFEEQRLQREGYVAALKHPEVIQAIGAGAVGKIAVTYVEWAGPHHQAVVVPWAILSGAADAFAFADRVAAAPIMRETATSISTSLLFSASQFASSGAIGERRAIDVSGDGPNNTGLPVALMRDRVVAEGITINGLPIMVKSSTYVSPFSIPNLDIYYEDCVIGGPGAFMISVDDPARFETAIRRKLVLEIAGLEPKIIPAAFRPEPRVDCMIGEKSRGRWYYPER